MVKRGAIAFRRMICPTKQSENRACVSCAIARRANLPHARGVVERPKSTAHFAHPASMRGTYRDRHETWSAGCDGRGWCRETYDIDASAKPCGPDTPRLASSLQSMMCRRRRQQSLVSGESAEKAVKPSRR